MSREVPSGWDIRRIADVASVKGGKRMPAGRPFADGKTNYPYIRVSDFSNGSIDRAGIVYVLPEDQKLIARYTISSRDVYISIAGTIGVCGMIPPDLDGAQLTENAAKIAVHSEAQLIPEFLTSLMSSEVVQRQITAAKGVGGGVPKLALFRIEGMTIPMPPLHEQRRIAEILSSVDEAIAATRAMIEQTRRVKQGVLERLLTKGIGHTRFKQTEIGEIPEGWRIATLGSIARGLEAGVSVNSENRPKQPGEIGILKTSCVSAGIFDPEEHKTVLLGERDRVKIPVRGDRIIISRMNTPNLVGANGYVENDIGDLFLPDRLWQLSTSENARWLAFLLASDKSRERLSAIATGTSGSMKNISKSKLLDLLLAIPSQAEQQEIASIMQEIDASIEADNRILKGQIATKSALMSDLLTGRKRVTDALPMAAE